MHEYTITEPPCPFLKICHVKFSGHGKVRKRVPDDEADCQDGEPASKSARVHAAANNNSSTAPAMDQGYGAEHASGYEEQPSQPLTTDQEFNNFFRTCSPLANSDDLQMGFRYMQHVTMPQLMAQETGIPDRNQQHNLDGTCYLPKPCMEVEEQVLTTTDQEIKDAQLPQNIFNSKDSVDFPSTASAAGAELYLEEQVPTIEQHQPMVQELTTAEKQFWRSMGVDPDNIVF
ncbi:hypothetical protein BAE44_0013379 [Dichanthelium oligosanthes]|uniref:NAC domain-containing protein n=1 Tax=Dichanthelium oligosanthes TaxID=888268 RepID=A0A1E5VKF1_9POAL|nr:hypothetical protein BAE44_0013379 [Dichanthelium oligosanthes]